MQRLGGVSIDSVAVLINQHIAKKACINIQNF